MQLTEAGIPAWEILATKMKISTAEVMKLSEKGLIPADKAIQALIDGMEKRFPNMMDKQSHSLQGLFSTIKDNLNNNLLKHFGDGISDAIKPRFERLVTWIDNNGPTLDKWASGIEKFTAGLTDSIASKVEAAAGYVKTHFIDNPDFQKLTTFDAKVAFVFDDLLASFNKYWESGGSAEVQGIADKVTKMLVDGIQNSTPQLVSIGTTLGTGIAKGIWSGFTSAARDIPIIGNFIKGNEKIAADQQSFANSSNKWGTYWSGVSQRFDNTFGAGTRKNLFPSFSEMGDNLRNYSPPSHAGGLSRVPYDGYRAVLHKDETVLTKGESDARRRGGGSRVSVNGPLIGTVVVNNDSDIQSIAQRLARELMSLQGNVATA